MFASDAQSSRRYPIGEQNQVLALPSSARNNEAVEIKEMGRFADFLHAWVLFLFTRVFQISVPGYLHAQSLKRRHIRQPQGPAEHHVKLVKAEFHLGRKDGLSAHDVEVHLRKGAIRLVRRVKNVEGSIIPSAARRRAPHGIAVSSHHAPDGAFEFRRGQRFKSVDQCAVPYLATLDHTLRGTRPSPIAQGRRALPRTVRH